MIMKLNIFLRNVAGNIVVSFFFSFFTLCVDPWLLWHHKQPLTSVLPQASSGCGLYKHVIGLTNTWKQGGIVFL